MIRRVGTPGRNEEGAWCSGEDLVGLSLLRVLPGMPSCAAACRRRAVLSGKAEEPRARLELGPMLGHSWAQGARIWIKASRSATSAVVIGERQDLQDGRRVSGPDLTAESDFMGIVEVAGLRPATRYFYKVLIDDGADPAAPSAFVTPPPDGAAGRLRFAVTSCVGLPEDAAPAWAELADVPIDLLLQLGDNVYAGSTDPEVQRRIYYAHRRIPVHRAVVARTPSLAIWDDWDYAGNNSDGTARGQGIFAQGRSRSSGPILPTDSRPTRGCISSSPGATSISSCSTGAITGARTMPRTMVKRPCSAPRSSPG